MSKKAFIERVANRGKISKAEAETIRTSNAKIRELTVSNDFLSAKLMPWARK